MNRHELVRRSDELACELVAPPPNADDVCPVCHSWRNTLGPYCTNCTQARDDLAFWCDTVIPISLYRKPSLLRDWLKFYKPGGEPQQPQYREPVGLILARFLLEHGDALYDHVDGYDAVCVVPSARQDPPHELAHVYDEYAGAVGPERADVLIRGEDEIRWRVYNDHSYRPATDVTGMTLLLLDDVYTTGAHSQSAASSLIAAGATVPAILVVARRLNLDFDDHVHAIWQRQAGHGFDFTDPPFWVDHRQGNTRNR